MAILVETSNTWGRAIIRGIGNYTRANEPWHLWVQAWGRGAPIPLPQTWRGQGIIADVWSPAHARFIDAIGVPVVNVSGVQLKGLSFPRVAVNLRAAARLAAEHFLDRGFRHFAYCGLQRLSLVENYCQEFVKVVTEFGYECSVFKPNTGTGRTFNWPAYHKKLVDWLRGLPKPVGILAWPCSRGQQVVHACREAGLLVPEQVAVLAGDEDELLCETCRPPLSGIDLNSERVGFEASALLGKLLHRRRPPKKPILVEPNGVILRQSTDTLSINNRNLARAIAFIRSHAADPISVKDVLVAVPVSRRWLEQRFQEILGRTPAAEIRRVHFERAKQLLKQTEMSIPAVAAASGFGSPEYLAYIFKRETGLTPRKYRNMVHGHETQRFPQEKHASRDGQAVRNREGSC